MIITQKELDGVAVVCLDGRLDAETSGDLAMKFATLIEQKKRDLIIDMANLEYISSAGLRVVLEVTKKMRMNGGDTYLVNVQEYVKKVLDISGLSTFLRIYGDSQAACEEIKKKSK